MPVKLLCDKCNEEIQKGLSITRWRKFNQDGSFTYSPAKFTLDYFSDDVIIHGKLLFCEKHFVEYFRELYKNGFEERRPNEKSSLHPGP